MDDIVTRARTRFDHVAAKKTLEEKYQSRMIFAHANGMWRAGPELQTLLKVCDDPEVVLLDLYQTPVRVNVKELMSLSQQRWQEQMNAWLVEWQELQRQR